MSSKFSIFTAASCLLTASCVLVSAGGVNAQEKTTYVGPSIGFSNGTTLYGVNAKFKVADNISVRPFVQFSSRSFGSVNATVTFYGASATYDFSLPSSGGFAPYAGIGYLGATASVSGPGGSLSGSDSSIYFEAGSDYNITDSIALNANYKFKDNGFFSFGGAYRF
jgi:opacity protein-like surface antigen